MTRGPAADGPGVPTGDDELLMACGCDAAQVWDHAGGPPTGHEADCPYCGALRAERAELQAASTAYLTETDESATPTRLLDRVMRTVSTELRPGRPLPLRTDAGRAFVTDVAVGNALRAVLDDDPAFVPRKFSAEAVGDDHALRVWLSITVSYEHFARHGDAQVRARVIEAIDRLFGLSVESVEIEIADVFTDLSPARS